MLVLQWNWDAMAFFVFNIVVTVVNLKLVLENSGRVHYFPEKDVEKVPKALLCGVVPLLMFSSVKRANNSKSRQKCLCTAYPFKVPL